MRGDDGFTVRPYQPGDETEILALFTACFGVTRSLAAWRWKYVDNPQGSLAISLAVDPAGKIVAHYGAYPCHLVDATSGVPRRILAYQVGDTMTRDTARGVGRRRTSLLFRVTQDFFARYCEGKIGFNYGFNEGRIRRYYLRLVRGSRFFETAPHHVLDPRRSLPPPADGGFRVERVRAAGPEYDALFERAVPGYRFLTLRDRAYLQWRYLDSPDVDYAVFAARSSDELVGWSAFRRQDDRLVWGDALFDPGHPEAVAEVLRHALEDPAHRNVSQVDGWFSAHPAWWSDRVASLGFEPRPEPQDLGLIYLGFEEPDPMERFRTAFYYTKGDGDLF